MNSIRENGETEEVEEQITELVDISDDGDTNGDQQTLITFGQVRLTLPSLFTYMYVTFTFPMEGQFKVYLQFVHSSVLRVYIYV